MTARIRVRRKKHGPGPKIPKGPTKVKVGFPAGVSSEVLDRAAYNQFGTTHIPERPFLTNAIEDNKAKYRRSMKKAAPKILRGQKSLKAVLSKLGLLAQGDIQTEITTLQNPPNTRETVKRKGSSNPLIDTGEMRGAVTFKTEK